MCVKFNALFNTLYFWHTSKMDYKFDTSSQWKHQVVPEDSGFYWDSNFHRYDDVIACRGVPIQKNVNFAHWEHLDEFVFDIYLSNGTVLEQRVKTLQRAKATAFLGNTNNAGKELSYLFSILTNKTFQNRYKKYKDYFEKYQRILLNDDNKGNRISTKNGTGDIYKNEEFFGSWFPSKDDLEVFQNTTYQCITFSKKSSTFLSSKKECHVDIFMDYDIVTQHLDHIGLGLDKFK